MYILLNKRKHNENHQIKSTKHIDNGVHPVWVTSLAQFQEWGGRFIEFFKMKMSTRYIICNYKDKFPQQEWHVSPRDVLLQELSLIWALLEHDQIINSHMVWHTSILQHNGNKNLILPISKIRLHSSSIKLASFFLYKKLDSKGIFQIPQDSTKIPHY